MRRLIIITEALGLPSPPAGLHLGAQPRFNTAGFINTGNPVLKAILDGLSVAHLPPPDLWL